MPDPNDDQKARPAEAARPVSEGAAATPRDQQERLREREKLERLRARLQRKFH
jgi:hypothetical protein